MSMKRCEKGHYYDPTKYTSCPNCGVAGLDMASTRPRTGDPGGGAERDTADAAAGTIPPTQPRWASGPRQAEGARTIGIMAKKLGIDPVVGWLVCIEGAERGRDYRLRSERNTIGRGPGMDVTIGGDDTVSREAHAVVSFEPKKRRFRLIAGQGRGLVYLNGDAVDVAADLSSHDEITVGETKLLFVPLCDESFGWDPQES